MVIHSCVVILNCGLGNVSKDDIATYPDDLTNQNALYTSNQIQNGLIESINQVIKRKFKNTIANKKYR